MKYPDDIPTRGPDFWRVRREVAKLNAPLILKLKAMPPLAHWPDRSVPFDWDNSQVLAFILPLVAGDRRHAISLFNAAKAKGAIVFDKDSNCWRGLDYKL